MQGTCFGETWKHTRKYTAQHVPQQNFTWKYYAYRRYLFDRHTVWLITIYVDQLIHRLDQLHETGFIHRDIKPDNIMVGLGKSSIIHLADFGMAKVYRDKKRNHIQKLIEMGFVGTQLFASPNAHATITQSRRDDLISLGYCILYLDWFSKYELTNQNLAQETYEN